MFDWFFIAAMNSECDSLTYSLSLSYVSVFLLLYVANTLYVVGEQRREKKITTLRTILNNSLGCRMRNEHQGIGETNIAAGWYFDFFCFV